MQTFLGFSVLLSLYHKEEPNFLRQSLDSIFHQTLLPTEIILVKDGPLTSELNIIVKEYVERYPALKVIPLAKNQGLGKALNEGLKHCSYDLVARMDTDDIAKPDRFARQIQAFREYPELDVVSAWVEEFEKDTSNVISTRKLPENHQDIIYYSKSRNPVNHPVVMFKKEAVMGVGGYQHFYLFEDYYLWVRMLMNGSKFYNIQESLLSFRFSSDMFMRRGGWKYAISEYCFQNCIRKMGYISYSRFTRNVLIRFVARIFPNSLRAMLYKKILRR